MVGLQSQEIIDFERDRRMIVKHLSKTYPGIQGWRRYTSAGAVSIPRMAIRMLRPTAWRMPPSNQGWPRCHMSLKESSEVYVIEEGHGTAYINGQAVELRPGLGGA